MKQILRIIAGAIALIILATTSSSVSSRPVADDFAQVDTYIRETMQRLPIRGLSLAIVKGNQILYMQGYGTANMAGDAVTPQTPFMLASVTKTFTALAIQQLAAEGKLDLDDALQTYVPEFRLADAEAAATITIRQLLEHTSGLSELEGTQPYLHSPETTFAGALERLGRFRPVSRPGAQYEYSNWNYVLLGEVIARASGQPYAEYVQGKILDPLEMTRASFDDYHSLPGVATGNLIVFGAPIPYDEKHIPVMLSAGYLTASAEDMAHYIIPFFNNGHHHDRSLLAVDGQGWFNTIWQWQAGRPGDISYGFAGGHNSVNTAILLFPLHRVGVVVLMNTRLDALLPGPTASDIAFNLARMVSGFSYEVPSNRAFYGSYAVLDGLLLIFCVVIGWQVRNLKDAGTRFHSMATADKIKYWLGIALNLILSVSVLAVPRMFGTRWQVVLYHRPETSLPLLAIGLCLGVLGVIKTLRTGYAT